MQRISTALRKRSPFVRLTRFASTEDQLTKNFYWKIPLQPKIASLNDKYSSTIFYSTHIEGHKAQFTFQLRREWEAKLATDKLAKIRNRPLPLALRFLGGQHIDVEQNVSQTEHIENDDHELDPNKLPDIEDDDTLARGLEHRRSLTEKLTHIDEIKANIYEGLKAKREDMPNDPHPYMSERYPAAWMMDYETYDDCEDYVEKSQFGTPDRSIPITRVPCYGCGGLLQCVDPSLPGYLPSELIRNQRQPALRKLTCQRCHFLINYNTALNLKVGPEDYINMISEIKDKKGLAIMMVDLLDFPCSIYPGMINIIGNDRPIVLVGNKVDLLPKDSEEYLKHLKRRLVDAVVEAGLPITNIKHTCLISAHTNYGVEDLITKLHAIWRYQGDVYLMGCTNVGKSTLFNALLRSDYCKVQASSIIKRATASIWPGTTLKMLKFPILRPTEKKLHERRLRLENQHIQKYEDKGLEMGRKKHHKYAAEPVMLIGHIGQTFLKDPEEQEQSTDIFALAKGSAPVHHVSEKSAQYAASRWCYDTPGVIQPDQIVHLLTTEELIRVIAKDVILPRTYHIVRGMTLFLAGLGRVDYVNGPERIRVSVFSSAKLPVLIVKTSEADKIYKDCLGTEVLGVPIGDKERLRKFPALKKPDEAIVVESGEHGDWVSCSDIILSSAGWVSVNLPRSSQAEFHAWTPESRGIHVRQPALLPHAGSAYRGKRMLGTPAYRQKIPTTFPI